MSDEVEGARCVQLLEWKTWGLKQLEEDTCSNSSGGIAKPAALGCPWGVHRPHTEPGVCTSKTTKYMAWRAHVQGEKERSHRIL